MNNNQDVGRVSAWDALTSTRVHQSVKIQEHWERLIQSNQILERRDIVGETIRDSEIHVLNDMEIEYHRLRMDFDRGIQRIRWCDIPTVENLTPEIVLRECVQSTESVFGAVGVDVLATYLEAMNYKTLLQPLALRALKDVEGYIQEVLVLTKSLSVVLDNPKAFFGVEDDQDARDKTVAYFARYINESVPEHVRTAFVAKIEYGLGNYVSCIASASFARCERAMPRFGVKFLLCMEDAEALMLDAERRLAEHLIALL